MAKDAIAMKLACSKQVIDWNSKHRKFLPRLCKNSPIVIHQRKLYCRQHSPVRDLAAERKARGEREYVGFQMRWRS